MKRYTVSLDARQAKMFFSPIRSKKQIIDLLMRTIKLFLINQSIDPPKVKGEVVLVVSKMSRLFYFSDKKYFSINCPFFVQDDVAGVSFWCSDLEVENRITSSVMGLLAEGGSFDANNIYDFMDPIAALEEGQKNFWELYMRLLTFDDGYIRYDDDEKNENGQKHPKNHYDIFHSQQSTFKVGLNREIDREELIDLVNIETSCHFLEQS